MKRVVVIGAGIGGLAAAAVLARAGLDVTVLEAHIYPGGCAGTFYHQGYQFDVGATLPAGFYPGGPMDLLAQAAGITAWPAKPAGLAMQVHLPGKITLAVRGDNQRWQERDDAFGIQARPFFEWQERTAEAMWELALRLPPWPPASLADGAELAQKGFPWLAKRPARYLSLLAADAFRPLAAHLNDASELLRLFIDGQLLISAQATSRLANALYGASALDLPRRGVVHLEGGMGTISQQLTQAVRQAGGKVLFRQLVTQVVLESERSWAVATNKGDTFPADLVIANLPPWNIANLLGDQLPPRLRNLFSKAPDGWGAFVLYLGVDGSVVPPGQALNPEVIHHQVIIREPMGEANTLFLSINPGWDVKRAPGGKRAMTLSTHTRLQPWWVLYKKDRSAYEQRKLEYTQRLLAAAEIALPGIREAASLILPGTPVTFQRFTYRHLGWVGGFPQTSLLRSWNPGLAPNLWMVGDSIFPGQSTAAAALGGLRVGQAALKSQKI